MASKNQAPVGKTSVGWPGVTSEFSASFPLATSCKPVDDEDEWEYEYSATETEVRIRLDCDKHLGPAC